MIERAIDGERVVYALDGRPVSLLSSLTESPPVRTPDQDHGKVVTAPDYDAPLPEFDL